MNRLASSRRISDTSAQAAFDMFLLIASDALDGMVRYRPFFPCLSIAILFSTGSMALGTLVVSHTSHPKSSLSHAIFDWIESAAEFVVSHRGVSP